MDTEGKILQQNSTARRIVGWVEIATAIVSLLTLVLITGVSLVSEKFSFWVLLLAAMPILYLTAGVGILKRKKGFWILSFILQIMAIFDVSIGNKFYWHWNPGLSLSFSMRIGGIGFGFDFLAAVMLVLLLRIRNERNIQSGGGEERQTAAP